MLVSEQAIHLFTKYVQNTENPTRCGKYGYISKLFC